MSAGVDFTKAIKEEWKTTAESIKHQMISRGYRSANELRNASQLILRGSRGGRTYTVPGTRKRYTASAPGEPPAVRTGAFRMSWKPEVMIDYSYGYAVVSKVESTQRTDNGKYLLGELLEDGSPGGKIAPRPHHQKIQQKALPKIMKIYNEPYV